MNEFYTEPSKLSCEKNAFFLGLKIDTTYAGRKGYPHCSVCYNADYFQLMLIVFVH